MTTPRPTTVQGAHGSALLLADVVGHALSLADRMTVAAITGACDLQPRDAYGVRWFDTRPMLSEHEHSTTEVDMAAQVLAYARMRRLTCGHAHKVHLVRFSKRALSL